MTGDKEVERGYFVWVEEAKLDAVLEILTDDQTCLGDLDHYEEYEKLINYFRGLKILTPLYEVRRRKR